MCKPYGIIDLLKKTSCFVFTIKPKAYFHFHSIFKNSKQTTVHKFGQANNLVSFELAFVICAKIIFSTRNNRKMSHQILKR